MLSNLLQSLLKEQVEVNLKIHGIQPARSFEQRALSKSFGGDTLQPARLAAATAEEIERLGNVVFDSMKKVITTVNPPSYNGFADDLLALFEGEFNGPLSQIRSFALQSLGRISSSNPVSHEEWFAAKADLTRAARTIDVKLLAASMMKPDDLIDPTARPSEVQ
ncbi:MAG TPA: hypothetical protein VK993_04800 [Chthoniobacterales bacterium]|nr:hypothetical protein [Chthoniobacterales bacterium]